MILGSAPVCQMLLQFLPTQLTHRLRGVAEILPLEMDVLPRFSFEEVAAPGISSSPRVGGIDLSTLHLRNPVGIPSPVIIPSRVHEFLSLLPGLPGRLIFFSCAVQILHRLLGAGLKLVQSGQRLLDVSSGVLVIYPKRGPGTFSSKGKERCLQEKETGIRTAGAAD